MTNISIQLTQNPKEKPADESNLKFGTVFTDHMFIMDYDRGQGWHDPRIIPYQNISLDPSAMVLHYSQEVFEGLKAYRTPNGEIQMFRPDENFKRLNHSNDRMCIPSIDEEFCVEATRKLVEVDQDWVPAAENTSLYIRPFIIATEPHIGVRPADSYQFIIILSPVGPYYSEGLNPVKIYIEDKYVRTVKGGTGTAKTGGNYASSLKAQAEAEEKGYSQVLWLDGMEHKYIDEVGSMNVFFVIGDVVVTPYLDGNILSGITRKSCIEILKSWDVKVSERRIAVDEIVKAYEIGELKEIFGTGTAAVISPVGIVRFKEKEMIINDGRIGNISRKLYDELTGIQWGKRKDPFGWTFKV